MKIDINSDVGESFGAYTLGFDDALMPYISSANIACGFHAGDASVMLKTVKCALKNNVKIGAHPGFKDLEGFGRRNIALPKSEIIPMVLYQMGALDAMIRAEGGRMHHVKPHGALYNMACDQLELATEIVKAILSYDASLILYALPNSMLQKAALAQGLPFKCEVFADRNVTDLGNLVPRTEPNAIIHDVTESANRISEMIHKGTVQSVSGQRISMKAETICVHGDHLEAVEFAKMLYHFLAEQGIALDKEA